MGRKGVSKRKSGQTRSKPMSSGTAKKISTVLRVDEKQPIDGGKDVVNSVPDKKKNPRKG